MNIRYTRRFAASFRSLPPDLKQALGRTLEWFIESPTSVGPANHPLHGAMCGKRAIPVDGDLRIVLAESGNYAEVTSLDGGGHGAVYRV